MSDDLWVADPETEHRRRALWGLLVLGLIAAIIVALMVFLLGSGGSDNSGLPDTNQVSKTTGPTSHSSTSGSSSQSSSSSTSSSPSTSTSTTATKSCATGTSCVLEGDAGGVINAVNAFRTNNGRSAVPGTTSGAAQQCSLNNGSGSCPQNYFWEPISPQDGAAVVKKIASRSSGRSFLLDAKIKSLQIGWAYVGGMYSCTVIGLF